MNFVKLWNITRTDINHPLLGKIKARGFIILDSAKAEKIRSIIYKDIGVKYIITDKNYRLKEKKKEKPIPVVKLKKQGRPKKYVDNGQSDGGFKDLSERHSTVKPAVGGEVREQSGESETIPSNGD